MKIFARNTAVAMIRWSLLGLTALMCGNALAQEEEGGTEISGFRVPDYDEQGNMTSQLFGEHALIGGGEVEVTGVRMEFYQGDKTIMTITSPQCFFNQKTREARSDSELLAVMDGFQVMGRGYKMQTGVRKVNIYNDSKVVIEGQAGGESMLGGGLLNIGAATEETAVPSTTEKTNKVTVITSTELFMDYATHQVNFTENVHVDDPELKMDCATMDVQFTDKNEIETIFADENVRMFNTQMSMDCETMFVQFTEGQIQSLKADRNVHMVDPKMSMDCEAMLVTFVEGQVQSLTADRNVRVKQPEMVMDCDRMLVEFDAGVVHSIKADDNVHVVDEQMEMDCETMFVQFAKTGEIDWIEALRNVKLFSDGREAEAGRAFYTLATNIFMLEENPSILQGRNRLTGDRIRFWRESGKMVCEPTARLVFYTDDQEAPAANIFGN